MKYFYWLEFLNLEKVFVFARLDLDKLTYSLSMDNVIRQQVCVMLEWYLLIVLGSPEYPNVHIFDWLKQRSALSSWVNQGQKWIPRTR